MMKMLLETKGDIPYHNIDFNLRWQYTPAKEKCVQKQNYAFEIIVIIFYFLFLANTDNETNARSLSRPRSAYLDGSCIAFSGRQHYGTVDFLNQYAIPG